MWKILKNNMSGTQKRYAAVCVIFIVFQVWLDLRLPGYMSAITTLVETEGSAVSDIVRHGIYMIICALGSMGTSMIVGFFAARVASGVAKTLREKVYDRILDFSMEEINHFSTASLINRNTNDITQIQNLVAMGLQAIVKAPILAVWAILKIAGKNWQWTTATGIAVIVLVIMLAFILRYAMPRFQKMQDLTDKLNRVTREQLTGIRVVRAYNAEDYQEKKFSDANDEITENNLAAHRVMALMGPGMTLISSGLTLSVYWAGTFIIAAAGAGSRLSIFSDMVVFSNYAMMVIMAFMMLNMILIILPRAQVSANRILEVLDTKARIKDGIRITRNTSEKPVEKGTVEFRNVSFRYPDGGDDVIKDISFKANQGETIAIIGATSSGKSTLIYLIPRLYDATEGQVFVDGIDVKEYSQEALRDRIGYVAQQAILFSGTVKNNIGYGNNGNEMPEGIVEEAAAVSQSTEFIMKKEGAFEAHVAQNGTNFSGGQRQRLSIARAVARKPEILVFDDSFSALDYKTDKAVRSALKKEAENTTLFIVAQRIGTIKDADKIIVLEHGRAVGIGTHSELLKTCSVYQEIARSQLTREELESA
ncbi:MAG: ABC transporter ATP-binding protein [Firmicutes bacterium]|nr:ABC transporter ATP-binding protein [Bacillota bacterium]